MPKMDREIMLSKLEHFRIADVILKPKRNINKYKVYENMWWVEFIPEFVSVYTRGERCNENGKYKTYSPQCNKEEDEARRKVVDGRMNAVFLERVYLLDKLDD